VPPPSRQRGRLRPQIGDDDIAAVHVDHHLAYFPDRQRVEQAESQGTPQPERHQVDRPEDEEQGVPVDAQGKARGYAFRGMQGGDVAVGYLAAEVEAPAGVPGNCCPTGVTGSPESAALVEIIRALQ